MAGFYERRKSRAALWCWRLAVISLPFFILTIFLHRSASITTQQAFWLIAFGIAMLLASLVFGVKAAMDLWEKGYQGGRATVNGIVLAILLLTPFGLELGKALQYPQLNDVASDVLAPPKFLVSVGAANSELPTDDYDDFTSRQIVSFYPALVSRRYNAPQERVVTSALEILDRWNWRIKSGRNLPAAEETNDQLAGSEEELAAAAEEDSNEALPDMIIQAEAKSFIMKLPSHLVIRLSTSDNSTLVDVRSASFWGKHDFGSNAENITQFLTALDESLAGLAGEI